MNTHEKLPEINLRALEPEDLDVLYRIENDRALWGEGVTNVPYSRYVLHDYIASSSADIFVDKQVRFMIVNADGVAVGIADLVNFDPRHRRAEVGLMLMSEYRGLGYASAALQELCRYSAEVLNINQLYAIVAADNSKSISMLKRIGFADSGVLKEWLCNGREYTDAILLQKKL
ncbi:MAG: GNAT family N-acetyltransferase [Prevotella sp.]|nr:GNAT family N-acetyltransferase [Prevotella sp.]